MTDEQQGSSVTPAESDGMETTEPVKDDVGPESGVERLSEDAGERKPYEFVGISPKGVAAKMREVDQRKMRTPTRALAIKGQRMKSVMRSGKIDRSIIYSCLVDLWMEARNVVNRAKLTVVTGKVYDKAKKTWVLTSAVDEGLVLKAIETTRAVLIDIDKVARGLEEEEVGVPHWLVELIKRELRGYPEARAALLAGIAAGPLKEVER